MAEKTWKRVVGYEELYEVSSDGQIRTIASQRLRKFKKDKYGYLQVGLSRNGELKFKTVHRVVAEAFIENPNSLPCINHKDEDKEDNNVENLEWCSVEYNANYGTRNKRISRPVIGTVIATGEKEYYSSLTAAGKGVNGFHQNIRNVINGLRKTAYGRTWEYADERGMFNAS